jgi:hypothetical protein
MIITDEIIKYNLELLEEVKIEYPILRDFENGLVHNNSVSRIGLDEFVSLISYKKEISKNGQEIFYTDKVYYEEVIEKVVELSSFKVKKIFLKKSLDNFCKLYTDWKTHKRYSSSRNIFYCAGLELSEPIIVNYFIQNKIDVIGELFKRSEFFFRRLSKPKYYSRELKMTQDFVEEFITFTKEKDLDIRKCNINTLINEVNDRLKPLMLIEEGLQVKYIGMDNTRFTPDKTYIVNASRISYLGYLEVKITDDKGLSTFYPYSNFEEISRQRNDLFKELGI